MPLGADDVQPAELAHAVAQEDVHATAGHVRGEGHGALLAGTGDDERLALVILRVQHVVLDAVPRELGREGLALVDGGGADEHRLALGVPLLDLGDHRVPLALLGAVHKVLEILADHRLVRRDLGDLELVDLEDLLGLGRGGTGHAGELLVHPEVVLDRDRRVGPGLLLDLHAFLRLDGLVQTIAPAAPGHLPSGELVDDDDLAGGGDDVFLVFVVQRPRLERVVEVVHRRDVALVEVGPAKEPLGLLDTRLGERDGVVLLLEDVVLALVELCGDAGERVIHLGRVLGLRADDERGAGLVDEDRVRLVDDAEVQLTLHRVGEVHDHVVTQVIESELAVLAVRDVGEVCLAPVDLAPVLVPPVQLLEGDVGVVHRALVVRDVAHGHAEGVVDRSHPSGAGLGEVVVRGDEVRTLALQRVQVERERRNERLALTGLHLGNVAAMERDPAKKLHVEVGLLQGAGARLPDRGEGLG